MTVKTYLAFKRFHKRSVKMSEWFAEQDYYAPLIGLLGAVLFCAWIWS